MGETGRFTEGPLLEEVPAPPAGVRLAVGARLVRVFDAPGTARRNDGGREAVILARARLGGGWAMLLAWTSYFVYENPPHQTALARWGWYRLDEARVKAVRAPRPSYEGAAWHGWHEDSELNAAIGQAALLLPEPLREQALAPLADPGRPG